MLLTVILERGPWIQVFDLGPVEIRPQLPGIKNSRHTRLQQARAELLLNLNSGASMRGPWSFFFFS